MADEIIAKYSIDQTDVNKLSVTLQEVTNLISNQQKEIKATYADKAIGEATTNMNNFGKASEGSTEKIKSLRTQIMEVRKEQQKFAEGSKEWEELAKKAGKLRDQWNEAGKAMTALASRTKVIDAITQGTRGAAAATALFGSENAALQATLMKLYGVHELVGLAVEENSFKTVLFGKVQETVAAISERTGLSMAASWAVATLGVSVLIAGIIFLVTKLDLFGTKAEEAFQKATTKINDNIAALTREKEILESLGKESYKIDVQISELKLDNAKLNKKKLEDDINKSIGSIFRSSIGILLGMDLLSKEDKKKLHDASEEIKNVQAEIIANKNKEEVAERKKELEDQKSVYDKIAVLAKKNSDEQLAAKIGSLEKQKEIDLLDAQLTVNQRKSIEAKYLVDIKNLRKEYANAQFDEFKKELDTEIALVRDNDKKIIEDKLADLESQRLAVEKGSDEEIQIYRQITEVKNRLAKNDTTLSPEKLQLTLNQNLQEFQTYWGEVLKAQMASDKQATEQAKKNHSIDLSLQKQFNLSLEQIDADYLKFKKETGEEDYEQFYKWEVKKRDEALKTKERLIETAKGAVASVGQFLTTLSTRQLDTIKSSFDKQNALLDAWHEKSLASAGDNAQKRAAVEERFSKMQKKIQQEQAISEAKVKRKQAEIDKLVKLADIASTTAISIVRAKANLAAVPPIIPGTVLPNPAYPAAVAIEAETIGTAIATAAIEGATVALTPIPQIPSFERGGEVLIGGKNNDGHLFGRSHRQGGMLINAQGGEYIWDIPTVQKHGDIIKAAHENRLEHLVFHKYIVPALQNKQATRTETESYDDFLLRTEVKNTMQVARENAKYIVRGISEAINSRGYINSRYHG